MSRILTGPQVGKEGVYLQEGLETPPTWHQTAVDGMDLRCLQHKAATSKWSFTLHHFHLKCFEYVNFSKKDSNDIISLNFMCYFEGLTMS